ncbi:MAG: conjugal transfer protein TrbE [Desulfocapsaceae bacterium]|nr:conjugal transfer protein TrbE [Desulfocapsaceae bacterium]
MLKLKDYRSEVKGLPDLLPYAALVAPGIVLNKNGSFLAGWEVRGQDTASSTADELAWVSLQAGNAIKLLGSGWMLHVDAVRRPHLAYPDRAAGHFPDPVTRLIDEERRTFFGRGLCYSTRTVLIATFKPDLQAAKLAGKTQSGTVSTPAMEKALNQFHSTIEELEDALSTVLHMERLAEYTAFDKDGGEYLVSDLLSHLQHCITGEMYPVRVPEVPMYLDAILGGVDLVGGISPKAGDSFLAVVAIDGLPQESWPAMLSSLEGLSMSYRYSTRYICLDQFDGIKAIDGYRKGWNQQIHRFIDQFLNNPNARVNRDALRMREDSEEALTEIQSGVVGMGYLTSCVVLMHENREMLDDQARELRRIFQTLGFGCRIENINALDAWLGTHPGNGYANLRRPLISSLNLADLLPLATVWTGSKYCPCPFYPLESRPLAVLTTDGSTPFWFNLHNGDIGHTLEVGPTGSGKSTMLGLIVAQFRCYPESRIVAFDKGMSLYPLCLGASGDHYDIGNDALSFAPLQRIDESEAEFSWAANWLANLAELQKLTILPNHRNAIHTALTTLKSNPDDMRSLTDFWHVVQDRDLKDALTHYTEAGAMGRLLDAKTDKLGFSNFMVFEIESLMEMGEANLVPVLLYIFRRFEKSLNGQPSLLILDEAWVMLGHPVFRAKIREWLKVLRKANCAVVLATQNLSDAKNSGIFDVLVDSCPTKVLLANHAARQENQHDLYIDVGLNERQIDIIANAIPKQDYYLLSPAGRRKVQLALGPKTLSFIGASDKESLLRIKQLVAEHGPDWPETWLKERGAL